MTKQKFVIYKRLSVEKKGQNQTGFRSQQEDINYYLAGIDATEVVGEFEEFISGAALIKPELEKAMQVCRDTGAILLVAKLDRLSRKVLTIAQLMDSDIEFKVTTYPSANNMMLHIMAAMCEEERSVIAQRVKRGLAIVKRDTPEKLAKGKDSTWYKSFKANQANHKSKSTSFATDAYKAPVVALVTKMIDYSKDSLTLAQIANNLNKEGFKTSRGGEWKPVGVSRLIKQHSLPYKKKTNR